MKVTAILKRWVLDDWTFPGHIVIRGNIYGDRGNKNRVGKDNRFFDSGRIRTSPVQKFSDDGRYAHTMNSVYELIPPYVKEG